jgi:glyoxylate reductase
MRLLYCSRRPVPEAAELGAERRPLAELFEQSDFVSLHVPLTADTHHLVDAPLLSRMKPSAILINTARGALIDEAALAQALSRGQLAAAGLDVFEHEPRVTPALCELPQVVLAPHAGSGTAQTRERMALAVAEDILRVLRGQPAQHAVPI